MNSTYSDRLGAGRAGDRIPAGVRFSMPSRPVPRPTQLLIQCYRVFFLEGKVVGARRWPPTTSSYSSTSAPRWPGLWQFPFVSMVTTDNPLVGLSLDIMARKWLCRFAVFYSEIGVLKDSNKQLHSTMLHHREHLRSVADIVNVFPWHATARKLHSPEPWPPN